MKVLSYLEIKIEDHNDLDNTSYSKMYKFLDEKGWSGTMRDFYSQPFKPELITELFEGWRSVDSSAFASYETDLFKVILIGNGENIEYNIKGSIHFELFPTPRTLDEFITDCERAGIELIWRVK